MKKKFLLSEKSGKNATYLTFTQGLEHPAIRKGVCDTLKNVCRHLTLQCRRIMS